jgi:hypothetical protein
MSFGQVLFRQKVKHHSFYCLEKIHLRIPFSLLQLNNKKEADLDFYLISFHLGSNENRKEYFLQEFNACEFGRNLHKRSTFQVKVIDSRIAPGLTHKHWTRLKKTVRRGKTL